MVMNTILGRVALACAVVAPAVLAQQTTVQAWIPYIHGSEDEDEVYASATLVVKTTIGNAVVAVIRDDSGFQQDEAANPVFTIGPNTFRVDWTLSYTESDASTTAVSTAREMYDCTFSGCPVATTGSCTFEGSGDEAELTGGTYTLAASDLRFHALALATPLPTALEDSCKGGDGDSEAKPTKTAGSDDEAAPSETPSGGWRASASWFGLVSGAVLALAI